MVATPQRGLWTARNGVVTGPQERMCAGPDLARVRNGTCVAFPVHMMNSYSPLVVGADAVVGGGAWLLDDVLEHEIDRWADAIELEVTAGSMSVDEAYELLRQRDPGW